MTRTHFRSLLVSFSAMLALAGCGGGGLTANGSATVTDSTSTSSGFHFPAGVRLDGGAGTITGMCTISRTSGGGDGVVVDLYGDAQGTGHAVRSMTLMAHSTAPATGQITADLGGDEYSGTCTIAVTGIDEGHGAVTLTTSGCALTHTTDTVHADVQLGLDGCTVI